MYNSIEQLLTERNLANLSASSFTKQMLRDYDESNIHILIYAVQNQHNLPSKSSIKKANRRQQRRQLSKQVGKGRRVVQRKVMNTPRRRYNNIATFSNRSNRPIMPFNISFPPMTIPPLSALALSPSGFPNSNILQLGLPGVTANSIPPLSCIQSFVSAPVNSSMPPNPIIPWMGIPNANFPLPPGHPLSLHSIPSQFPQMINQRKRKIMNRQTAQKHPLSGKFIYTLRNRPPKKRQERQESRAAVNNLEINQRQKKYQVLSPEMITIKALRQKCENALRPQILEIQTEKLKQTKQTIEKKQVPLYFQKKKESQKRRRQQKHELIKKNRKALLKIFGTKIFQQGWFISRKQILEALNYNQPSSQQIQGIDDLFATNIEEKPELEKEEVMDSIAQIFMIEETSSEVLVTPCISG